MYRILQKRGLTPKQTFYRVEAPHVARKVQPGQFVIVRAFENGERIPLTPFRWSREDGWFDLVVLSRGKTTLRMERELKEGDYILDVAGPLGNPAPIGEYGRVLAIGVMTGLVEVYPIAKALKEAGNYIRSLHVVPQPFVFLKEEFEEFSDMHEVLAYPMDDQWYPNLATKAAERVKEILSSESFDMVFIVGPLHSEYAVFKVVREFGIPMEVDLHPIMVDGTGMCGACRVTVGGEVKFACVDGPAFDAYQVDFEELMKRNAYYKDREKIALDEYMKKIGGEA